MALTNGTRLGPYEILAPLGAGGMGEVYRARDTRLDRTVAIKVLPPHLAETPEARQRFEREARAVSALNHPHICTLYDVGRQDGVDFLVMECVEGETLAARLEKGPLPLAQVLRYGAEIAGALDRAHRSGVVHRDLKPGNIMLTASGAKLLDFGLAKAPAPPVTGVTLTVEATRTAPITQQGTIVGTFQYMSPEQVEGRDVDARSDIFSFGAVLYEMVTGRLAFPGRSPMSVASAILEKEPEPISTLQSLTPPALDRAIRVCLAKDPDDRWQTARDLLRELKWIADGGSPVASAPAGVTPGSRARLRGGVLWGAAALLLAALTGFVVWNARPSPLPQPVTRAVIALPPGQRLAGLDKPALALSRDGRQLAYVATQGGPQQIYLRAMDGLDAKPIPGTEGAFNPFFSPDGQWLGFFAGQKLKKVATGGGAVLTLSDAPDPEGADWSSQGQIAFVPSTVSGVLQVPEGGGAPQPLTRLEKEATHRWPAFLPGGALLFAYGATSGNWENQHIAVRPVEAGERRNLVRDGTHPAFAPSGHLVYAQRGSLIAASFDPARLTVTGAAVSVVEGVLQASTGAAQYSLSASGSLVYVPGGLQSARLTLVWVTRDGVEQPVAGAPAQGYAYPRLSPDGTRLAVSVAEPETQIYLFDLAREMLTRLTRVGSLNSLPAWASDGERVAFVSDRDGARNLYWQRTDGSGAPERLTTSEYNHTPMSFSPDGKLLVFGEINHPVTGFDIWALRLNDRAAQPVLATAANESSPRFSPDGRWLAYSSDESGRQEIYLQPFPGPGGRWQISSDGGREPVWNRNGRELFYRNGDKMMAVEIATQPAVAAGKPRLLFEGPYEPTVFTAPNYDVSPDGRRFLLLKRGGQAAPTHINVVLNWFEELTRRVPPGKK